MKVFVRPSATICDSLSELWIKETVNISEYTDNLYYAPLRGLVSSGYPRLVSGIFVRMTNRYSKMTEAKLNRISALLKEKWSTKAGDRKKQTATEFPT